MGGDRSGSFCPKESVTKALAAIGALIELKPYGPMTPGRRAAERAGRIRQGSVVSVKDVPSHVLAERAALLRK